MKYREFGATGFRVPVVGQGSWPRPDRDALRRGIELGMTHIDTAEMYGDGRSEEIVGEAIAGLDRASLFVVSKVLPSNADRRGIVRACERSLKRLGTDYLDCYLLHWRGSVPLEETMEGLEALVDSGKIRSLGVSNLDAGELEIAREALRAAPLACDQLLYNLNERSIELHEFAWAREHRAAIVAYTPLARRSTREGEAALERVARAHGVTPEAVALAFLAREPFAFVIPKANAIEHVEANAAAGDLVLDPDEIAAIDAAFPVADRAGALPTG